MNDASALLGPLERTLNEFFPFIGWDAVYLENTYAEYVFAALFFAGAVIGFQLIQRIVLSRLNRLAQKTKTDIDDMLIGVVQSVRPPFYVFIAFYLALQLLVIPAGIVDRLVTVILIIWAVYQVAVTAQTVVNYIVERRFSEEGDATTRSALQLLGSIAKGIIWGFGILMVLSNLGVNVSSLLAGVGIGGIAIAFALQNILSDLFSSFSIYFDKPFKVGDFIIIGSDMGVVKKIGVKSTRLQALGGEELVVSNQELTSTRVQNYKKMEERRVVFKFGVVYGASAEKLRAANDIVKAAVEAQADARFDRTHFVSFDDSALAFEVVYHVLSPDYNKYMDIQQEINFAIKKGFEEKGIEMAYPTQTVYLAKE